MSPSFLGTGKILQPLSLSKRNIEIDDLANDPSERRNIVGQEPEVARAKSCGLGWIPPTTQVAIARVWPPKSIRKLTKPSEIWGTSSDDPPTMLWRS